jgi:hypothetical protein
MFGLSRSFISIDGLRFTLCAINALGSIFLANKAGVENVEFLKGEIEHIPRGVG